MLKHLLTTYSPDDTAMLNNSPFSTQLASKDKLDPCQPRNPTRICQVIWFLEYIKRFFISVLSISISTFTRSAIHPIIIMKFTSITTFVHLLSVSFLTVLAAPLGSRDVYVPPVLYPRQGTVWLVGEQHHVVWWVKGLSMTRNNTWYHFFFPPGILPTHP